MTTRTLTFKSSDLGQNTDLVLCFATPDSIGTVPGGRVNGNELSAKQYPIVWKTTTLSAQGESSLTATFVNAPGFCNAQIGGHKVITAGNYIPVQVGQETTLNVENNVRPPVFYFSDPTSVAGDIIKATNITGQTVNVGLGFIADAEQPNEIMVPTSVFRNVPNGSAVSDTFIPVVRAYANIGSYVEGQLIDRDLTGIQPVWEADLLSLQPSTAIVIQASEITPPPVQPVKHVQIHAATEEIPTANVPPPKVDVREEREKVYSAVLAFALAENVVQGVKHIAEHLIYKSYQVQFTYAEGSTEAALNLTLPSGVTCDQAERELRSVIETYLSTAPFSPKLKGSFSNGYPHSSTGSNGLDRDFNELTLGPRPQARISIKSRSASQLVSAGENFSYWAEINPASNEWFSGSASFNGNVNTTGPTYTRIRANSTRGYLTAASNILEQLSNGSSSGIGTQTQQNAISVTKNRPLSRKSSAVGLNRIAVY